MRGRLLRGFIIACSFETEKILPLTSKLAKEGGFDIRPYISTCSGNGWDKRSHVLSVHSTHIKVLEMCAELKWTPCLIFEADAIYSAENLHLSLLLAMQENKYWDIMPMGITAFDMKKFMKDPNWPTWQKKPHSMQIAGTGGGCHAYMVRNPTMVADYMRKKNVVWLLTGVPYTPCIEYIFTTNMTIILPTEVPVIQSNKLYREGIAWYVDSKGTIQYQYYTDRLIDQMVNTPILIGLFVLAIVCWLGHSRMRKST